MPDFRIYDDFASEEMTAASGYSVEFHFKKGKVVALELHQPNGDFRAGPQVR